MVWIHQNELWELTLAEYFGDNTRSFDDPDIDGDEDGMPFELNRRSSSSSANHHSHGDVYSTAAGLYPRAFVPDVIYSQTTSPRMLHRFWGCPL